MITAQSIDCEQLIQEISEYDANALKKLLIDKLVEEENKASYIKLRENDYWFKHHPEDYEVVRKLYDILTCGNELHQYTRYDIMCEDIRDYIDEYIDDFTINYNIISECLNPLQMKLLAFYYSKFNDDELYEMCKALSYNNKRRVKSRIIQNRLAMCKYITTYISNYI